MPIGFGMVAQNQSDGIHTGLFGFGVVSGRDGFGVGACDQYWPTYGASFTLASCGGDFRYMEGAIGSLCLCMQFRGMLAEFTIGAY